MPTTTKERKAVRFVARVTPADKQLFAKAASLEGRSVSTFVVVHVREAALQVVHQSNLVQLNADKSRLFVEALLAPPRPPTPTMLESIRTYRKSVKSDLD